MNLSDIKDKIDEYFDSISSNKLYEIALKYKLIKMAKKEFKVGETFQCGLIKVKCVKNNGTCKDCIFENMDCQMMLGEETILKEIFGSCYRDNREDNTDVIFVKVED